MCTVCKRRRRRVTCSTGPAGYYSVCAILPTLIRIFKGRGADAAESSVCGFCWQIFSRFQRRKNFRPTRDRGGAGDRVVFRPPSKFRFLPPRLRGRSSARTEDRSSGDTVRGAPARTCRAVTRGAVRGGGCGTVLRHCCGGGGGYASGGKKVRRARRSSKNMVHPAVAAQWP